jgi:hypothetical protein
VRLNFQEIILTIPQFALGKDAKLAGLSAIDHFPKIRSICHKVISAQAVTNKQAVRNES